ncbi:MAG TPA: 2-oxo-hepta-3-ene-1,7-dioic acid hydratase [Ilumatobacter sp.]|nr:2-oxo-hepta-3-ene-1,7-dioic acid hydratase [Ilumatobacter sp.]
MAVDRALSDDDVRTEATRLDAAEQAATQIDQTTLRHPEMTIADAYAVQDAWLAIRLGRGERVVGHKIGLTSRAMQAAMRIDTPDSGFLTDAMDFPAGAVLDAGRFCDPKLELELAFRLAEDLDGSDLTVDDVLDATEYVVPAVELIAARTHRVDPASGRPRTVVDTIADNAADAGIVCGPVPIGPRERDLRWVGAIGSRNGTVEETGLAAGVLDHPARGIAWLARRYGEHGTQRLRAGDIVLAGSFTRPIDVRPGDQFRFDYGPLGTFELRFSA